jgi:hypothetical protein
MKDAPVGHATRILMAVLLPATAQATVAEASIVQTITQELRIALWWATLAGGVEVSGYTLLLLQQS